MGAKKTVRIAGLATLLIVFVLLTVDFLFWQFIPKSVVYEIDTASARFRTRWSVLGCPVARSVTETDFSRLAAQLSLAGDTPSWRLIERWRISFGRGYPDVTTTRYEAALSHCDTLTAVLHIHELRDNPVPPEEKKRLVAHFLDLLDRGDIRTMKDETMAMEKEIAGPKPRDR